MGRSLKVENILEVGGLFFRLGLTAFGGPAAHVAMMHNEVVTRRAWLSDQEFLDLLGAANLIPGPNSTEMAIHLGYRRAGWPGLVVAGLAFILPAAGMVGLLAWAYVQYGATPQAENLLYGVKPVVIAVIALALWQLGKKAIRSTATALAGLIVAIGSLLGGNTLGLLFVGGLGLMLFANRRRWIPWMSALALTPSFSGLSSFQVSDSPPLAQVFAIFFKIGAVLFGSGYVLLAFLRDDLVVRLGWLSDQQLVDAVAIGQVTPGPVFTTATFVGYLLGQGWGAVVATVAIFLPSFFFVAISSPLVPRMRTSPWAAALLDGVNAASLGLMAAVTLQLARSTFVDLFTVVLMGGALITLIRFKLNTAWLVLGGALAGMIFQAALNS